MRRRWWMVLAKRMLMISSREASVPSDVPNLIQLTGPMTTLGAGRGILPYRSHISKWP